MENNLLKKRVAIIGAGASGIPAAKEALEHNWIPVVFESSTDIGGLWRYKPYETEEGTVMKTTVINSSKEMTAYSTFVPPSHFANYMHNRDMLEYLRLYANSFNFEKYLNLEHKVINVERHKDYNNNGQWIVQFKKNNSEVFVEIFDAILLCTGHHTTPYFPPKWPGQEYFKGEITHAHSYKDHHGYDDKIVVVIGVGNSGVDIAVELSRIAKQVYLVTRRGTWLLFRNMDHSYPTDMALNTRWWHILRQIVPLSATVWYLEKTFGRRFNHSKFGLKPKHSILSAHPTVNDELPNRLCCGTIRVKPNIKEFLPDGKGLIFEDGSELKHVDNIILATGYSFNFNLAENGKLIPVNENDINLYLYMYPPQLNNKNNLAVIGLIQPLGSIMPISEMQSRLFFEVLNGNTTLPKAKEMQKI
ncbi:Dimethylaniline monooxygenase [N-oxide-forming] [Meloidogyne graminicola]|uniref:Flavin-containing monooxygenase n=1 Tax=Meloidogyne graminicola TaxID=189291 RepID=A0A8S9ZVN2_9BILA|nr:Dimethylaniline monooxygenase [N-oxide-forming] [Meloidogyne graminicola]